MTIGVDRMAAPPTWRAASGDDRIGVIAECGGLATAEEQPYMTTINVVGEASQSLDRIAAIIFCFGRIAFDASWRRDSPFR